MVHLSKPTHSPATYLLATGLLACGGGSGAAGMSVPYSTNETTVIRPGDATTSVTTPGAGDCLMIADAPGEQCVTPLEECAQGAGVDVIVNENGELVDTICLPPESEIVDVLDIDNGELPQNANNSVLVVDSSVTFEEGLAVDANNVVFYGEDPAEAVVVGDLSIDGNNAIVRGITIDGNVSVVKNNATFVFCVITGNVTIRASSTVITGCDIWGDVTIEDSWNNSEITGNRIQGDYSDGGNNTLCTDNVTFSDENDDGSITDDELGDALDCDSP